MRAPLKATPGRQGAVAPWAQGRDNYFFAVVPDREAAAWIDDVADWLRSRYRLKGQRFAAERYHVTLHGGALPGGTEAELVARMAAAADGMSPAGFAVGFDHALSFPGGGEEHPFVLSFSDQLWGLRTLHAALGRAMAANGLLVARSFTPHLTMLYDPCVVPETDIEPIRWTAHDFVLIRSLHGQSHYQFLGRWPLKPLPTH
ncbi:2'-5' RNA ligase [Bosea caraganae]|uniref:2'-5' RNA ligase n=1 Tax=Bosea caraganae TaxID=2763117 RepID=A0A370L4U9_9HYPH|nr:2'-5' RNA ligase family protein [Bosea caraganae]RDJ24063.1 2'-5' RNA ligase [Bosea caraganae]RDJ30105.1 2'-5' RNA ligase [Bosea caraganae]